MDLWTTRRTTAQNRGIEQDSASLRPEGEATRSQRERSCWGERSLKGRRGCRLPFRVCPPSRPSIASQVGQARDDPDPSPYASEAGSPSRLVAPRSIGLCAFPTLARDTLTRPPEP